MCSSDLKTEFYEVEILRYLNLNGVIRLDIKLNSNEELKEFILFASENNEENRPFDFYVSGEKYYGHCGAFYYDSNYNARLVMLSFYKEKFQEERRGKSIFIENLENISLKQRNSLKKLLKLLTEKMIISECESEEVLKDFSEVECGCGLMHYVENLDKWLKDNGERLEDLIQRNITEC